MAKITPHPADQELTDAIDAGVKTSGYDAVDADTGEIHAVVGGAYKFNPSAVKTKKMLNVPVLSQKGLGTIYVVMLSAMFVGKDIEEKSGKDGINKEPATIAYVIDLMTGKPAQIIISTVQAGVLRESYKNDAYVGKAFQFENLGKQNEKKYNSVRVNEIDVPEGLDIEGIRALVAIPAAA